MVFYPDGSVIDECARFAIHRTEKDDFSYNISTPVGIFTVELPSRPKQKPEIKINKDLSHTVLGLNLRNLLQSFISIFKIKKEQIASSLISDYFCI
jgi:hypothetical protein